ncbi:chitin deacetylase, partial [Rhizopus stolonifer]
MHDKKEAKPVDLTETITPHNEEWLKEFDLTDIVGNVRPVGSGICKAPKCDGTDNDECFESCGNKATPDDIYGCPERDNWALTFDDGPSNFTTDLLDILDEADIKATFCIMGAHAKQYPEIVKRAYESGHQIASHTYSHAHLMSLTNEEIIYELRATEEVIKEIIGIRPRYIRPPYGEADARVKQIFKKLGYKALMWNVDPTDYNVHMLPDGAQQIQQMFDKIASGTPSNLNAHSDPGFISLQHDLYNTSIQQVPKIIESLKDKGFSFSTAAQCLKQNSAESFSEMKASQQQEQSQMSSAGSLSSSFFVTLGLAIA